MLMLIRRGWSRAEGGRCPKTIMDGESVLIWQRTRKCVGRDGRWQVENETCAMPDVFKHMLLFFVKRRKTNDVKPGM